MEDKLDEVILFAQDDLQVWHERRPGYTIFGSYVARVLLTSKRLLLLSTGDSGAARRLLVGAAFGPIGSMVFGQTPTAELDAGALEVEGSAAIPLERLTDHAAHRRCDCANYVGVQYTKDAEAVMQCCFMPKDSVAWSGAERWAAKITEARAALPRGPYR